MLPMMLDNDRLSAPNMSGTYPPMNPPTDAPIQIKVFGDMVRDGRIELPLEDWKSTGLPLT